jgi:hypothetical protein
MSKIDAHALVLCFEISRIEFFHHETRDLWAGEQVRQLRRMQKLEASGLIGNVGVGVVSDSGYCGFETVERAVKQSIGERFQSQSPVRFPLYELGERHEALRV